MKDSNVLLNSRKVAELRRGDDEICPWVMLHVARDEMCVAGKSRAVENLVLGVGELRVNIRRLCQFARGDNVIDEGVYFIG